MKIFTILSSILISINCWAQALDQTFGNQGKLLLAGSGTFNSCKILQDGKLLLIGKDSSSNAIIVRLNSSGTYDNTFANQGKLTLGNGDASAPQILGDGSAIVVQSGKLIKIKYSGLIDSSFNNSANILSDFVIMPNGKIIGVGTDRKSLVQFNTNGSTDTTFGVNGTLTVFTQSQTIQQIEIDPQNGDLFLLDSGGSNFYYKIWKLDSNLTLSPSYSSGGFNSRGFKIYKNALYQSISVNNGDGSFAQLRKIKLDLSGLEFSNSAENRDFTADMIDFQNDDKSLQLTLATGNLSKVVKINRRNPNGYFDNSFGVNGTFTITLNEIEYLPSRLIGFDNTLNKLYFIASGYNDLLIVRYNPNQLSTGEIQKSKIKIFPNPIENIAHFSSIVKFGNIYDMSGKLVLKNLQGKNINISNLQKGAYVFTGVDSENLDFSLKITKK